jgi:hypothetical protein
MTTHQRVSPTLFLYSIFLFTTNPYKFKQAKSSSTIYDTAALLIALPRTPGTGSNANSLENARHFFADM